MADEPKPTPSTVKVSDRMKEQVSAIEKDLLQLIKECAGKKLTLEQVRANHRADPNDVFQSAQDFRNAEKAVASKMTMLMDMHAQTIVALFNEKKEAEEL
jgi:hypothetical protein